MRKVIFVGGTSFSGSTFFHLQLANNDAAFATGESVWLFQPNHQRHVNRLRMVAPETRELWREVLRNGKENLYTTIFEMYPNVRWIVDSSKHPFWQQEQTKRLRASGIDVRHTLIWKTPVEFAASTKKRNRFSTWASEWVDYHRLYFSCFDEWSTVRYRDLASDRGCTLAMVCDYLDIPYQIGMEEYWTRAYHALGGNVTARYHLAAPETAQSMLENTFDSGRMGQYRQNQYTPVTDPDVINAVNVARDGNPRILEVENYLELCSVPDAQQITPPAGLRYTASALTIHRMRRTVQEGMGRMRYSAKIEEILSV